MLEPAAWTTPAAEKRREEASTTAGVPHAPLAMDLFAWLRSGQACRAAQLLAERRQLDACVPPVGDRPDQGNALRAAWFEALDRWHFIQGDLSPILFFASRIWGLVLHTSPIGCAPPSGGDGFDGRLHRLIGAAFPSLARERTAARQVCAVIARQGALEAGDRRTWAAFSATLRQECVSLLRWRELTGERPLGHAARCYAAIGGSAAWIWRGAFADGARMPNRAAPTPLDSLGEWRFGRAVLEGSQADVAAPEWTLLGWSVPRVTELAETAVACMTACLRMRGHQLDAFGLRAELPIPNTGITWGMWLRLCRRVGLQVTARALPGLAVSDFPALCRLHDGSCLLLLAEAPQGYRVYAPGVHFPFRRVERGRLGPEQVAFLCSMAGEGRPERLARRPVRPLKFDVLGQWHYHGAVANPPAKRALHSAARAWPEIRTTPPALTTLSLPELLAAHRSLAAPGSPLHGSFRRINLHGSTEMLCWQQIPLAMDELLAAVAQLPGRGDAACVAAQVAMHVIDFLRIHPFLNGNRRMAMVFGEVLARKQGFVLNWSGLSRVELYHAVRCAAAGHPGFLVQALLRQMSPASSSWFSRGQLETR